MIEGRNQLTCFPFFLVLLIPRRVCLFRLINVLIDPESAWENGRWLVKNVPNGRVVPVLCSALQHSRPDVCRAKDEVNALCLHQSVIFASVCLSLSIQSPVLSYCKRPRLGKCKGVVRQWKRWFTPFGEGVQVRFRALWEVQ